MKGPVYKRDVFKLHKTNEFSVGCLNCAAYAVHVMLCYAMVWNEWYLYAMEFLCCAIRFVSYAILWFMLFKISIARFYIQVNKSFCNCLSHT